MITERPHIEIEGNKPKKLSDKHVALVRRGAELTRLIKDQQTELKKINDQLKKEIGPGVSLVLPEEVRVPISESFTQSINDVDLLRAVLGRRFNKLVDRSESFKPTAELLSLTLLADDEAFAINSCLATRTSQTVKYLPIKTQK